MPLYAQTHTQPREGEKVKKTAGRGVIVLRPWAQAGCAVSAGGAGCAR